MTRISDPGPDSGRFSKAPREHEDGTLHVEQHLDRTLRALDNVQPPSAMHRRLEDSLGARPAQRASSLGFFGRLRGDTPRLAFAIAPFALVLVLVLVLAGAGVLRRGSSPAHVSPLPVPSAVQDRPTGGVTRDASHPVPSASALDAQQPGPAAVMAPTGAIHLGIVNSAPPSSGGSTSADVLPSAQELDQAALDDLHTPSHPAPPLHSTEQERMVALMLRHGEKHDLAELSPDRRSAFDAQQTSAFQVFFDPPADPRLLHQGEQTPDPQHTASPNPTTMPPAEGSPQ